MLCVKATLTVFFEEPFWVGLYERQWADRYEVCKITFGAEPKDHQVYEFLLRHGDSLSFSPALAAEAAAPRPANPKRMQREAHRQTQQGLAIGTKAQQALKLQQGQSKKARQADKRQRREEAAERQYALQQAKRKAKHRGH